MNEWISVKDGLPPKNEKFLFHYYYGIGLGNWTKTYCFKKNGDSYLSDNMAYCLVLWPSNHMRGAEEYAMLWDEDKMIEMDMKWMPLPEPPHE